MYGQHTVWHVPYNVNMIQATFFVSLSNMVKSMFVEHPCKVLVAFINIIIKNIWFHHLPFLLNYSTPSSNSISQSAGIAVVLQSMPHSRIWRDHPATHQREPVSEHMSNYTFYGYCLFHLPLYHLQRNWSLLISDIAWHADLCMWFLHHCINKSPLQGTFYSQMNSNSLGIVFCIFTTATCVKEFQHGFGTIVDGCVIGPYILPPKLKVPYIFPISIGYVGGFCAIKCPTRRDFSTITHPHFSPDY